MLDCISIKNIALIDQALIEFGGGLNILTGETGAGKSIIIDSLNFALGEKTNKGVIRTGQKTARVEAVFSLNNKEVIESIQDKGIEVDDDGVIIITRVINESGKVSTKINGQSVTVSMLKKISDELIDIHGQHEHQSLLDPSKHVYLLDGFCPDEIDELKKDLYKELKKYRELKKEIGQLTQIDGEDRMEYLEYRIDELKAADLKSGEEESLQEEKRISAAAEKLQKAVNDGVLALYDGDEATAIDSVNEALYALEAVSDYDKRLASLAERLSEVSAEIDDISRDLRRYAGNIDANPQLLEKIEDRLSQIYIIKRKYGGTVEKALDALVQMEEERDMLAGLAPRLEKLNEQLEESSRRVQDICGGITKIRKENAVVMEKQIMEALKDLGMEDALVEFVIDKGSVTPNGRDKVELFIAANRGEGLKPLSKIASGGEMSRIMLAVKSISASTGSIETFIFDEIDTGVSGRTAQKVAEKMALISGGSQIICITHLPQIAAMADRHILISKEKDEEKTATTTKELIENEIILELGRLLGGAEITEQTLKAAAEMKGLANKIKEEQNPHAS